MARSSDGDEDARRYQEVCAVLNMDRTALDEAWKCFQRISASYTLEGDSLHWLACALYVACRKGTMPTVGRRSFVEGNCVSLTQLLRACKLSLVQFFNKMKKWSDMANLSHEMRQKVVRLERNFNVSTVIFKKFEPIFLDIFENPSKDPTKQRSRKQNRKTLCTSSEVFSFCWTLFIHVKGHFSALSDDLVNSFHLLLCCVDLLFSNAVMAGRSDILRVGFEGLPDKYGTKEYKAPSEPLCIIEWLCKTHQGLVVEAKGIKEHWWKPYIKRIMEKKVLKGKIDGLSNLLEMANFEPNCKSVNKEYETFVLSSGDFDERVFLGDNANEEIGTTARHGTYQADMDYQMKFRSSMMERHLENSRDSMRQSTPLTGRRHLTNRESLLATPVSMATQSVHRLQTLLAEKKPVPSAILTEIFEKCTNNPYDGIMARVNEMGETFCTCFSEPSDGHSDSHMEFARKRLQLGQTLYFKALENIVIDEKKKNPPKDLSGLLDYDAFHRSLFACCLEIVIFSYNSQRSFPWILETFDLQPYYFYKVIEILIRGEEGLSRDVVKHLNHIEEQILENLAWKSESPLWEALSVSGLPVPSCEDVSLPSQMESTAPLIGSSSAIHVLQSPLSHPVYRRAIVTGGTPQSPLATPSPDRLNTIFPSNGGGTPGARRRLFRTEGGAISTQPSTSKDGEKPKPVPFTPRPGQIILQAVKGENGVTYIPISGLTAIPGSPHQIAKVSTQTVGQQTVPTPQEAPTTTPPKRTGSLGLFFRKVYHLAGVRLRELCDRLKVTNEELRRQIWTCFEHSLMNSTDLMTDRHLDQLIMCAVYVICKVKLQDQSFQEIMKCYRLQPQASSHVYRSVLIASNNAPPPAANRRNSGSSDNSKSGESTSPPLSGDKEEKVGGAAAESKGSRAECLSSMRSSSTLPVPHPNSQPPTPTRLTGTGTHFEFEDRGDLITFYNKVYVPTLQTFAVKFQFNGSAESPPLSPLPRLNANPMSPFRRVFSKHSLYISPMKNPNFPPSPSRPMSYSLGRSPAKDLQAINKMLQMGEKKPGKRIMNDERENESPAKKPALNEDVTFRKIHDVMAERQGGSGPPNIAE